MYKYTGVKYFKYMNTQVLQRCWKSMCSQAHTAGWHKAEHMTNDILSKLQLRTVVKHGHIPSEPSLFSLI